MAEVAGRVETVGGEQVFAGAAAHAAQRVRSPDLDHANGSRCERLAPVGTVGVDDVGI
jgi:hypothetical protein